MASSYQVSADNPNGLDSLKNLTTNKYSIGEYQYPVDLGRTEDLQHYVAFFINVRGKSKLNTDKINESINVTNPIFSAGDNGSINKVVSAIGLKAIGLGAAGVLGSLATSFLDGDPRKARSSGNRTARTAFVAAAAAATTLGSLKAAEWLGGNLLEPDKRFRLQDVITLHVEERPSVRYGMQYQTADLGSLLGLLSQVNDLSDLTKVGKDAAVLGLLNVARIPGLLAGSGGARLGDAIGAFAKVKTNPFREVLFEAVEHRKFTFRHRFFPKNINESNNVRNIIRLFKEHMHPRLAASNTFYIYPSEFEIKYFFGDRKNPYLYEMSRCALIDMSVDYGGETFSTFKNGAPTEISMSLTFQELDLHTRDTIVAGNY